MRVICPRCGAQREGRRWEVLGWWDLHARLHHVPRAARAGTVPVPGRESKTGPEPQEVNDAHAH